MGEPCIELAKLFSIAVDFPKTGDPAVIPPNLYVKEYPDFMEKPDKPTYESPNVIGKLFREVQGISEGAGSITSFTREVARQSYDPDMEVDGFMDYVDDAFYHKTNYDYKLGNLMDYYGIKTEAEILSGNIMKMSKSFTKRRDAEAINMAVWKGTIYLSFAWVWTPQLIKSREEENQDENDTEQSLDNFSLVVAFELTTLDFVSFVIYDDEDGSGIIYGFPMSYFSCLHFLCEKSIDVGMNGLLWGCF
ncbi:RNA-dependent RNA polymerase, eukaryotic-type [Sesbania bispinosa]|nr:RNA-dependent RNA polymerase, eukaryotic-type [Sesbania bispinosa]